MDDATGSSSTNEKVDELSNLLKYEVAGLEHPADILRDLLKQAGAPLDEEGFDKVKEFLDAVK